MAKNIKKIAQLMGATKMEPVPETGGGALGAARLVKIVAELQNRLEPSQGKRQGRPPDPDWVHHPQVPMSEDTLKKLALLAEKASSLERSVTPMQVAAKLLENALANWETSSSPEV